MLIIDINIYQGRSRKDLIDGAKKIMKIYESISGWINKIMKIYESISGWINKIMKIYESIFDGIRDMKIYE